MRAAAVAGDVVLAAAPVLAATQRESVGAALTGPDHAAAIDCLATAIGHEAGHEPEDGQRAVAQVVLNRLRHPAYPKTVCGVVFQGSQRRTGCQFTFTCDGALLRPLSPRLRAAALRLATEAIDGLSPPTVGAATHYHADYVSPRWAPALVRVGSIGRHIFYRFPGDAEGRPAAALAPAVSAVFSAWGLTAARLSVHGGKVAILP